MESIIKYDTLVYMVSNKAKEAPSPHEVRLAPLDTNPVFQSFGDEFYCL